MFILYIDVCKTLTKPYHIFNFKKEQRMMKINMESQFEKKTFVYCDK